MADNPIEPLVLEADPVLGNALASYLSNRALRLARGGVFFLLVGFVLTVALWNVEATIAAPVTVAVMGVVGLLVGWYVLHTWNREVVLYEHGFSYREGSAVVFLHYTEIRSIHQRAERLVYGGILRRTVFRITLITERDETIVLDSVYRRVEDLGPRLEAQINQALTPQVGARIARGEQVAFGGGLLLSASGLHHNESGSTLAWEQFGGYGIEQRQLVLLASDGVVWQRVPLVVLVNVTLLLDILKSKRPAAPA